MEYFVALRDYTGLMMVVVGLLAPLNMIASASEWEKIKPACIDTQAFDGIVVVACPEPVATPENFEIYPATSTCTGFDFNIWMGRAQPVEQAI